MLRKLKLIYSLYNLFHRKSLEHNLAPYQKLGVKKSYYDPVSSADFVGKDTGGLGPRVPISHLPDTTLYKELGSEARASFDAWADNGYGYLPGYLNGGQVDKINATITRLHDSGELPFSYRNKLMFAVRKSPYLADLWNDPKLLAFLNVLIGGRANLFQSINFFHGSEQKTHSDSIHMTTFPLGGLLGVWVALEDVGPDQGPLHYYPGSHNMPYLLNDAYDNEGGRLTVGEKTYQDYEALVAEKIAGTSYERRVFKAKKGDVFIWHANLLHGGEPHRDRDRTRKSMVLHYFDATRVCYHEITQRPALFAPG